MNNNQFQIPNTFMTEAEALFGEKRTVKWGKIKVCECGKFAINSWQEPGCPYL